MRPNYGWRIAISLSILLLVFPGCLIQKVKAQDITIMNPSLEGIARENAVPPFWMKCGISPDIQPGKCCNVILPASDGATYEGMLSSPIWVEGMSPTLSGVLRKGVKYTMSFDLAYPPVYYTQQVASGTMAIYAGHKAGDTTVVLWKSPLFYHKDWKRYTIEFTPDADYEHISFYSYFNPCEGCKLAGALIDNISETIREVPHITVNARNTCKGVNHGVATVVASGGGAPYTYSWEPVNRTGESIDNLRKGAYSVTVTGANGASVTESFEIGEYELALDATITEVACFGYNNGEIALKAAGGSAPYGFSIDGGQTFSTSSVFGSLKPGSYDLVVMDAAYCRASYPAVKVEQPAPLKVVQVLTTAVSCESVKDGKVAVWATGGTPPYRYSIPDAGPWQADSVLNKLDEGHYYYEVTDGHDCFAGGNVTIEKEWRDCAVFIPSAFSPNGDGINDIFRAVIHDDIREYQMMVFDRWGRLVFESKNPEMGWDGSIKGTTITVGSYLYVVTYTDSKGQGRKHTGNLTMVR
jgi:gliding motility-associated-like protein